MEHESDDELVPHALSDPEALCLEVYPGLLGVLTAMTGDRSLAEDLAQDAMLRAWEHRKRLARMESPRGWIYQVALNQLRSRHRRLKRERERAPFLRSPSTTSDPDIASAVDARDLLMSLPERQRAALALRHISGLSVREAAGALQCAEGTVKALTFQATHALRRTLAAGDPVTTRSEDP